VGSEKGHHAEIKPEKALYTAAKTNNQRHVTKTSLGNEEMKDHRKREREREREIKAQR